MSDPSTIDLEKLRGMAFAGATDNEMADSLLIPISDLQEFEPEIRQSRANRKIYLRRHQTETAKEHNATMLIFLGKHELGQDDRIKPDDRRPEPRLDPKVG